MLWIKNISKKTLIPSKVNNILSNSKVVTKKVLFLRDYHSSTFYLFLPLNIYSISVENTK